MHCWLWGLSNSRFSRVSQPDFLLHFKTLRPNIHFQFPFYGNFVKVFGNFLWWTSKYMSLYIFCKYESKSDYIWSVNQRPPYGLLKVWHFYPENNQTKIYGTHWYLSLVKSSRSWLPLIFPFGPYVALL